MLEFDEEIGEFKIFSMHNFENQDELVISGKRFPLRGKLRSISSFYHSMFGYISDDYTFVWVEFRQAVILELQKSHSIVSGVINGTSIANEEGLRPKRLFTDYLNTWGKDIELYYKPARFKNLFEGTKIQSIIDISLIEMGNSNQVFLYVLHQSDFEKTMGTITRQPISKLSIFEFVQENNESTDLNYIMTVECISYFARNIIPAT